MVLTNRTGTRQFAPAVQTLKPLLKTGLDLGGKKRGIVTRDITQ